MVLSSSRGQANFRGPKASRPRTWGFEAKAKDFKMCPRGRPRGQGRPRGLHLWYLHSAVLATVYCRRMIVAVLVVFHTLSIKKSKFDSRIVIRMTFAATNFSSLPPPDPKRLKNLTFKHVFELHLYVIKRVDGVGKFNVKFNVIY